jgi:Putative Ig domain
MQISGKHLVLIALSSVVLAGCGGGEVESANGSVNTPPVITGSPSTTHSAGTAYSFTPAATDPDGDRLTFTVTNLPAWASFNQSNGALTGTPTESDVGMTGQITIEVSDSKAIVQLPAFRIQIASGAPPPPPPANVAPTIAGTPAMTATVGQTYNFVPVGADANGDTLTYSITNRPSWLTFTPATGALSGTPSAAGTSSNIQITVSDGTLTASLPAFNIVVSSTAPANRAPTITGTPGTTATVGAAYTFQPVGSDPDGNSLTYSIQNRPSWATFSTSTGRLTGTPATANVGATASITISVTDGTATTSLPSFIINVSAQPNRAPTISGSPATSVLALAAYAFQPSATDPDGNTLTFSIQNRPAWATFNTSTGRLSGTPAATDIATYNNIVITVSDGTASASLPSFSLAVLQNANGTATVNWTAPTTNTDGSSLTNLAGFRIAYGTSQTNLDRSVDIDNASLSTYTVNNLSSGTWYFAVYAVNSSGVESDISNVGSKAIP